MWFLNTFLLLHGDGILIGVHLNTLLRPKIYILLRQEPHLVHRHHDQIWLICEVIGIQTILNAAAYVQRK